MGAFVQQNAKQATQAFDRESLGGFIHEHEPRKGFFYDAREAVAAKLEGDGHSLETNGLTAVVEITSSMRRSPSAMITVVVPTPDAQVWFDDAPTNQRGRERMFRTPALRQNGTYTIKARWTENGRTVDQQRQVQVQPGQSVTVNFQADAPERLPSPRPPGYRGELASCRATRWFWCNRPA